MKMRVLLAILGTFIAFQGAAEEPKRIDLWSGLPPGESELSEGETLPRRSNENPPSIRITKITKPQMEVYEPDDSKRTGAAVLIFPGGGYNYVVRDKEGEEPAKWLNSLGITSFVVRYRTKNQDGNPPSVRPMQDAQRALRLVRSKASEWKLDPTRIGVMGFSAGGHVAALAATRFQENCYPPRDEIDRGSCRPDFAVLVYAAYLWDTATQALTSETPVTEKTPPTLLIHTHDDGLSSLGPVSFYAALKQKKIPAEIHIYQSGGHGYGLRPVQGSSVHTWIEPAARWLEAKVKN